MDKKANIRAIHRKDVGYEKEIQWRLTNYGLGFNRIFWSYSFMLYIHEILEKYVINNS